VCAYSLDHITPSRLGVNVVANTTTTTSFNKDVSRHLALASTTRLDIRLKRSLRPSFQRTRYRLQRQSASNLFVCAIDIQRVVGLGGLEPPASPLSGVRSNHLSYRPNVSSSQWWSQSGSNRRPPACKAGALPAELWPRCSVLNSAGRIPALGRNL
jgi:hypothetical protein